ncbi:MAG: HWE histidine kinase domain-containing protein, partial [Tistlia sp.]
QIQGSDILQLIAPAYRTRWGEHHRRVCDGETLSWEFELVSLKGTQRHMESHAVPLALPDGSVAQLAVTRDVSQRKRDEQALREGEQRLREILGALPTAVYTTDAEGRLTFYNEAAADFWGCRPILGEAAWRGAWRIFQPDGSPLPHEACPMVVALKERRALRHAEAICERPDGRRIPFAAYPTPMWRADGKLAGAVNMLVDISRHKQAEEHQQLLVNELNHRVKNTLATVQSIVRHSLRGAESVESFRATFGGRLMALSRAHDLLTQRHWEGAALTVLLEQAVAPYEGATQALAPRSPGARVRLDGPDVALSARQALVLAMAFHELATNAAKYGALSTEEGRLEIVWTIEEAAADAPAQLLLRWCEQGGPRVEPPSRRGFGSRLIERSVPGELMGDVRLDYQPEGLRCAMRIPVGVADVLH